MAIVRHLAIALFGVLIAYAAAALLIVLCMFVEWEEILRASGALSGWLVVWMFGLITWKALLPALLVIALAESFAIRTVLFYAIVGGLGFAGLAVNLGLAEHRPAGGASLGRDVEIAAGAGIAAGLVYWAIAGRRAGAWHEVEPGRQGGET
jgi:hypothetical protein